MTHLLAFALGSLIGYVVGVCLATLGRSLDVSEFDVPDDFGDERVTPRPTIGAPTAWRIYRSGPFGEVEISAPDQWTYTTGRN